MASETAKEQLKRKAKKLVTDSYEGDYKKAFDHYANCPALKDGTTPPTVEGYKARPTPKVGKVSCTTKNGKIDKPGLELFLEEAKVGMSWTRGRWVDEIFKVVDKDNDKKISWMEFEAMLKQ